MQYGYHPIRRASEVYMQRMDENRLWRGMASRQAVVEDATQLLEPASKPFRHRICKGSQFQNLVSDHYMPRVRFIRTSGEVATYWTSAQRGAYQISWHVQNHGTIHQREQQYPYRQVSHRADSRSGKVLDEVV